MQSVLVPYHPASHEHPETAPTASTEPECWGHISQRVLLSAEYQPASQLTQTVAMASEMLPAEQTWHASEPWLGLYFPGAQRVQLPVVIANPASHAHSNIEPTAASDKEFRGHSAHSVFTFVEYELSAHPTHISAIALEMFPAGQS